jgi:signal transduction histidine kinase/CheY-like chemotaxis protein
MDNNPLKILLVEDNPGDARLIEEMLRESGSIQFELLHREHLDEAMKCLEEVSFDILLVDLNLPDSQGLETVTRIISAAPALPIIVLTGLKDEMIGIQAVQKGIQDYLVKGQIDNRILARTITYAIQRKKVEEELRRAQEELEQRVKERTVELTRVNEQLIQEIQERKRVEEAIRLNESRLEALLKLNEMKTSSMEDIADFVLEEGIKLTKSKIGFIGFMKDNGSVMDLHSWSKSAMEECSITDKPIQYRIERAGLYGEAIRQKKTIIVNDYLAPNAYKKGYPEGHVKLLRLVVLPVIDDNRVAAVIAVGNKDKEYDELDLRQLKLLMDGMGEIIERTRSEEESRRLREELAYLTRIATMGELTASLAHELNQPLTAIMSNAQAAQRLLSSHVPDLSEVCNALTDIINDNRRASEVIHRVRSLLKHGDLVRTPVGINKLIRETIALVHSEFVISNISLKLNLSTNLPLVLGDRIQLQQVILNLLLNGAEAMRDVEPGSRELIIRTFHDAPSTVRVAIQDSGIGMQPAKLRQIFDPFFTTKPDGLGMGLSINHSIIEAHGGRIWATQNPDRGATFFFTLPVYKEESK